MQVRVCLSFSCLAVTSSVGRPTFLHPPIQVRARPAKPSRSQAALRHPVQAAKRPASTPAPPATPSPRPGSAHRPAGPFPCLSVFVRARPARGAELLPLSRPGVSARGRGARGEGLWAGASGPRGRRRGPPPRRSRLLCPKWLKTLDLRPVFT